jgi:signal transduction histidine kinase/CheY-like chemotaxis protein
MTDCGFVYVLLNGSEINMDKIADFLSAMGAYALPSAILLVEIIAAAVIAAAHFSMRTKNRRAAAELENERLFCRAIKENGTYAQLLVRKSDFCPIYASDSYKKFTGCDIEDMRFDFSRIEPAIPKDSYKEFLKNYRRWDGSEPLYAEFEMQSLGGYVRLTAMRTKDGLYELYTFEDITQLHAHLEELNTHLDELQRISDSKTTFLSNMSHEIRTPMNGIIGMIELAKKYIEEDSQAKQYLEKAGTLSQYLLSLINDILDMSRIEAGKVELEKKPFDLYAMADKLDSMYRKNIEEKGVKFCVDFIDFSTRYFIGDEMRINQVVLNFLSNAQKFTSEGEIVLTFRQMLIEDGMADIMISIRDTGIGMEQEFLTHIFRPFEQESVGITKKHGGSGLGMAITDQLVELMGGKIVIDTMPQKGTKFMVYLTLPIADEADIRSDGADDFEGTDNETAGYDGMRILLAEDNEINAEIAIEILETDGAKVEHAEDGRQAVDMFAAHDEGYYDVILMDIQMPVMDGREAAREIRRLDRKDAAEIPIFALSADAFLEDERESLKAGMNGHFSKPIDFGLLKKKILRLHRTKP